MIDQDIDLVRRTRPLDPPDDPRVKARAWARLQAEFDAPARRRVHVPWRLALAGALACAVGGAAAVVVMQTGRSAPPQVVPTLELAAQTVERQAVPRPRPDQWVYSPELRNWAIAPGNTIGTLRGRIRVDQWWRFDGRRIAESVQGSKMTVQGVLTPGEKRPPRHHPADVDGGYVWGPGIWKSSPRGLYDYVATLPTDPDALLAKIRHDTGDKGRDVTTFWRIAQILDDDKLIPPKTTGALYRVLAKISGVTVERGAKDFAGRPGIAVSRSEDGTKIELILDPKTYRFLGDRTIATKDRYFRKKLIAHAGQVENESADLGAHVVDHPGER